MQGSEVRSQSPIQCQAPPPPWGFSGSKGTGGRAGKPQAGGWAGRQAPKNLTCDPGRPHRLKGLRDAEAGSALWGGGLPGPGIGGGGAGEMNMAQRRRKGPKDGNWATERHREVRDPESTIRD